MGRKRIRPVQQKPKFGRLKTFRITRKSHIEGRQERFNWKEDSQINRISDTEIEIYVPEDYFRSIVHGDLSISVHRNLKFNIEVGDIVYLYDESASLDAQGVVTSILYMATLDRLAINFE
jgi:hypothetical protein